MSATRALVDTHLQRPPAACIGTAGWQIPSSSRSAFAESGSHLARYASRLAVVEINSSFYRPHAARVYERWAATVPDSFRFAVKCPKNITHDRHLQNVRQPLERFLGEVAGLGRKLGPILVQLAPSHEFDLSSRHTIPDTTPRASRRSGGVRAAACDMVIGGSRPAARRFFVLAWRPTRHECRDSSSPAAGPALPTIAGTGARACTGRSISFDVLEQHAQRLKTVGVETWTVFDNTAMGTAAGNALTLVELLLDPSA